MRLALYQPEIPQNTGTLMRLCACLGLSLDIIHPCGFVFDDKKLRRAGMDYSDIAVVNHHTSWNEFLSFAKTHGHRIILMDAKAVKPYTQFAFHENDIVLMGTESSGVPEDIFHQLPSLLIPMIPGCRSLNVALAAAMVVGEAVRQIKRFHE